MRTSTSWLAILVPLVNLLSAGLAHAQQAEGPTVWPGPDWPIATPESQGLTAGPSTPWRRMRRHPAAAAGASSGTVTSSRSGATRSGWPTSSRRPKGPWGRRSRAGRRLAPGPARRPGGEALSGHRYRNPGQPPRLARRDHDPAPGHDDRRLRRRPSAEAGLPPRNRRLLFERRREHAGRAVDPPVQRGPGCGAQAGGHGPDRRAGRGVALARECLSLRRPSPA